MLLWRSIDQRTSGPVNTHLTAGPGIYFNAFIHVYSPRAGADNPLVTNVDANRNPISLCPFVAGLKKNCFEVWFYIHFFHVSPYIYFYSPGQGQTFHWGQNFYDNRKAFSLCPYVASFKMISSKSDFIPWGQTFDVNRKPLSLRPFVASFKQISLNSDFIHFF